ncbi:ABC transporter substrate-binding protein [Treponema brennaborense]|uniref:sn-glycerol-3-phosphate-binding periplasmic protein UgpB n=1 Tax=Treponema brennaborense (strain DSM 12168 / CIP 105900 / DD5/3) TaxID=906968 RepID=F4LKP0_TREBD|nr:sugar ABC transporter substrate-binding protein [Treponema brennaborense]AEE15501.1 extracellular solute-binding protein family 1 [Treponema brennaborense DSM 12168]
MKKFTAVLLIACLAGSIAFAGGGKENSETAVLQVAVWDKNQEPGLTQILNDFTAATGIKAKIQVTPWEQYWTMLEAGATGGSLPDVFWMHSNEFSKYASYGMLLDLSVRIAGSEKISLTNYPQDIVELYTWKNKTYAVPKDIDTIALWYNKTMFAAAGVPYPDESWTWDTFRNACKKLTTGDGRQYGFTLKTSDNQSGWYNIVYDMGGSIISADKKKSGFDQIGTVNALQFVADLAKDGSMPPYEVLSENTAEALFEAGKVAMVMMGSWMLPELCNNDYVKKHGDIAVLPKDAGTGRRVSIYNGLGWAASAATKQPEKVWTLIEYLGSEKAQRKQSDLGIVMSAYKGTTENWISAYPDFNLQAYIDMTADMVIRPYSASTVAWENMATEKLIDVWTGKRNAAEVCREIARLMNGMLAEE